MSEAHKHTVRIDRAKPLAAEAHSGHNRYHPDIEPVLEVADARVQRFEGRRLAERTGAGRHA